MLVILIVCGWVLVHPCNCREGSSHLTFSPRDGKGWGSDTSFFDIALTALAFLSFGIFLLNLLLNALLFPSVSATTVTNPGPILTMITGSASGGIITGGTALGKRSRQKRAIFTPEIDFMVAAKLLTSFVTNSIETMTRRHECIPRQFCEGNRRARVVGKGFQFLIPFISFSISYIGKSLGIHDELTKHVDAILVGASEANCQEHFPTPDCKKE